MVTEPGVTGLAEAAQVGREHVEVVAQSGHLWFPQGPVERVAMDQDDAVTAAGLVVDESHVGERSGRSPFGINIDDIFYVAI
jgi:hypothetical protein